MKLKKAHYLLTGLILIFTQSLSAQNVFQKTYGGTAADYADGNNAGGIKATSDAGFIISGVTNSYGTLGADARDLYISKCDLLGRITWSRELGITNKRQEGSLVFPMSDGGYFVGGRTFEDLDANDSWLIKKYNSVGTSVHERVLGKYSVTNNGGAAWDDEIFAAEETAVPNIVAMTGFTMNYRSSMEKDITFVLYDVSAGNVSLTRHIGAAGLDDAGKDFCADNGAYSYTLLGETRIGPSATMDFLAVHLTAVTFNQSTYKTFGTTGTDVPTSINKTADGGYFMAGFSDGPGSAGGNDMLLIKTDASYVVTWARMIGGAGDDRAYQAEQTSDGGYIIVGQTSSYGAGSDDMFVVKLNSSGNLSWAKTYGGTGIDRGRNVGVRSDGGFFFSGTCSEPISPAGNGQDIYVVATSSTGYSGGCNELVVTPSVNSSITLASVTNGLAAQNTVQIEVIPATAMVNNTSTPTLTCKCENYNPNREIVGAVQVCHNSTGQYYINKIPGYNNYLWTITGGTFATAPGATDTMVNINFTNTNAQLIVATNGGDCSDFVIDTINMTIDNISTNITTGDSLLCIGDNTTLTAVTSNNQGAVSGWVWNPTGPNNPVNNINPGATTTYTVTVTDGWGCTASDTIRVAVFNYPVVNIGANDTVCNGGPVLLNATTTGASYVWNTTAGTATINAATSGIYWVDVTTNGCTTRDSIILGISVPPTINIAGDDSICIGESTTLTANPSGGSPSYTYLWAGGLGSANNITTSPIINTTYTLTVTEGFGCTNTGTQLVNVFGYPVVNIGPNDTVCNGGPVALNATTAGGSYLWNTTATTGSINAATSGIYWVNVSVNGCTTRDSITLGISVPPSISIAGDDSICIGESTTLTANPSGGSPSYTYLWAGGLGSANNITTSPIINTTYTVTVTEGFGCTNTASQLVNVFGYPVVNIGPNDTVCNGGPVALNATTVGASYLWNTTATSANINAATSGIYWVNVSVNGCTTRDSITLGISVPPSISIAGDDSICIGESTTLTATPSGGSPSYTYTWAGGLGSTNNITTSPILNTTYTVTVAEGFGCTNTATQLVNVFGYPVVNIGPNDTVCNGGPVALNATTVGASYLWNTTATSANISAATSGIYWVNVSVNGCTTRDSITLGISVPPSISIAGDDSICIGESTTLTATPSGGSPSYTYTWAGGLGSANNITVSPILNTTYTVTVAEGFGCTNTATQLVNVFNYPIVSLGPDSGICDGVVPFVQLDAQNPGAIYTWSTTAGTQTINVITSGTYWVDVNMNGCTSRDSVSVTFSTTPTSNYTGITTICAGESTTLYGNGSGGTTPYTYTWSQGPTVADSIILSPAIDANYSLITSDIGGCSDTAFFTINVNPNPVVDLGPDTTGCFNDPVILFAPSTTGTILWSTGVGTDSITVPAAATVWLDITELGCTTRDSITITYYPIPVVDLGADTVICSIQSITLDATNTFSTYLWSTSATTPTISVGQTNTYWVQVSSCGSTYTDSITVFIDTFSVFTVSLVPNHCGSSDGALTVGSNSIYPITYLWTAGTSGNNPVLTNINDGTYTVEGTDSVGCKNTLTVPVVCTPAEMIITQLITPNGDGKNDTWIIEGVSNFPNVKVTVYNRWGNEVYSSTPYNNDWDGTSTSGISIGNGLLPTGTYFYVVDVYGDGTDIRSGYLEFQP